jgi:hypothetical protein
MAAVRSVDSIIDGGENQSGMDLTIGDDNDDMMRVLRMSCVCDPGAGKDLGSNYGIRIA